MKLIPGHNYAVLTGDVVGSSKLHATAREKLPAALKEASRAARRLYGKCVPLDADVFRGDSWQLIVFEAKLGLRVAIFFAAFLRGSFPHVNLDTRISIGIGGIQFVPGGRIRQGDGPAFRESGWGLEAMPKRRRLWLAIADMKAPAGIESMLGLMDTVTERWTEKQALAVTGRLQGMPQAKIARLWKPPIKQPVVARHLRQAGWEAVETGLAYVENTLNELSDDK